MQRWLLIPFVCLMACVHEVGEWPDAASEDTSARMADEAAAGADADLRLVHLGTDPNDGNEEGNRGAEQEESAGGGGNEADGIGADGSVCSGALCDWPADWVGMEREVLARVNDFRRLGASCAGDLYPTVGELGWNENLAQAARGHSMDMGEQGYFSHDSLDGRSPWERMRDAAFQGSPVAENIAAGSVTAADVVQNWMNSPGHCRNIMSSRATVLGVGYAFVPGSPYGHYWTQAFGAD